jgi:hypothetical protein
MHKLQRIHQRQKVNLLAVCMQLPGHFKGNETPIAKTPQEVRAFWLNSTHSLDMPGSDCL